MSIMMTIDDIKALIASDESKTLELKKTTGELKDGMHAACAFLNTKGGMADFRCHTEVAEDCWSASDR